MSDFHSVYEKYAPDVFRFSLYLSSNRSEAEDITSETFVRVWASPGPIEMSTVKGYLFTTARNLFLHRLRGRSREALLDTDFEDRQTGPHAQAERKEKLNLVLAELQKLPETSRAALLMHAMDEMPYEEIARVLGISLSAVKVKIYRARLALAGLQNL